MKEYLTVKEFSRLSGIEQTTLRYWDDIGLFSPVKRDPENHYRYYSPEQIIAVNFITVLSSLHIPLKTIGALEDVRTPESIMDLIKQQEKRLDMEMRRLRECYSIIHTRLDLIDYGIRLENGFRAVEGIREESSYRPVYGKDGSSTIDVDEMRVCVLGRGTRPYILGPPADFREGEKFYEPFMRFCQQAEELRINLNYPIGAYHENMESFLKAPGCPDYFLSMDPTGNRVREAGEYMVGFSRGFYGEMGDLPERMAAYARKNGLTLSGPVYTMYLHDEICIKDPDQYLVQICVAVS